MSNDPNRTEFDFPAMESVNPRVLTCKNCGLDATMVLTDGKTKWSTCDKCRSLWSSFEVYRFTDDPEPEWKMKSIRRVEHRNPGVRGDPKFPCPECGGPTYPYADLVAWRGCDSRKCDGRMRYFKELDKMRRNPHLVRGGGRSREHWTTKGVGGIQPKELEGALRKITWDETAPKEARIFALSLLNGDVELMSKDRKVPVQQAAMFWLGKIVESMTTASPRPATMNQVAALTRFVARTNPRPKKLPFFDPKKIVGGPVTPELAMVVTRRGVRVPVGDPEAVAREFAYLTLNNFEEFWIGVVDNKFHMMGRYLISRGSLNQSAVYVSEVLRVVLYSGFIHFICVHNHPSGNPTPSADDMEITRRLEEAARLVGFTVLDHIVVAKTPRALTPMLRVGSGSAFAPAAIDVNVVHEQGGFAGEQDGKSLPDVMEVDYKAFSRMGLLGGGVSRY